MRFVNRATGAILEPPAGGETMYAANSLYVPQREEASVAAVKKRAPRKSKKEDD